MRNRPMWGIIGGTAFIVFIAYVASDGKTSTFWKLLLLVSLLFGGLGVIVVVVGLSFAKGTPTWIITSTVILAFFVWGYILNELHKKLFHKK